MNSWLFNEPLRLWRHMQIWHAMRLLSRILRRSRQNMKDYAAARRILDANLPLRRMPLFDWQEDNEENGR